MQKVSLLTALKSRHVLISVLAGIVIAFALAVFLAVTAPFPAYVIALIGVGAACIYTGLGVFGALKTYRQCSCGKVISNLVDSCRHCGAKVPEELKKK